MAGRYLVTGVQLGMLIGQDKPEDRQELVDNIVKDQYVGYSKKPIKEDVKNVRRLHGEN